MENETIEQEARRLRDLIYIDSHGPVTNERWEYLKEGWIQDIEWLRMTANKMPKKEIEKKNGQVEQI